VSEPRRCVSCGGPLASDNSGRFCALCDRSGRGERDDKRVLIFALGLYPFRDRLGVLGLDYVFFHHFLSPGLQEELAQLRQQIYRRTNPPRPLPLDEAAAWLAQEQDVELDAVISPSPMSASPDWLDLPRRAGSDSMVHTSPPRGFDVLLADAAGRSPAPRRRAAEVSKRLAELEEQLPAAHGTLHLALICGTPPLPPGIRVAQGLRPVPGVGQVPAIVLKVFSAKERDIRKPYEDAVGDQFEYTKAKKDYAPIEVSWVERGPLPHLEMVCFPYRGKVPAPSVVQTHFRRSRSPVSRFHDGDIKARDYAYALRTWAMLILSDRRGMSNREALTFWNKRTLHHLRYDYTRHDDKTQSGESLLSQELARLRERLKSWQPETGTR
jgi:hypothetical protein